MRTVNTAIAALLLPAVLHGAPALAATYEVGPGLGLETIGDVPWESLAAGDLVLISWRTDPYHEKFVICAAGTESEPIVIRGVPGPGGELPVIDGRDATTRSELNFWNEERGLLKIGGSNTPSDCHPEWIVVENLDLKSARPPYSFTGRSGLTDYAGNAASVYIEDGDHIVIRNLIIHDSGNGIFGSAAASDVLIEGCHIYDNGIEDRIYEHNNYTEVDGIVFQYNRFGPLRTGCLGNNLKDRSAGTVIRYNWIEDGNRQLDLVESDHDEIVALASYATTFVYGNVLIEHDGEGNSQIVHYGGDGGDESYYRKGTLFFFNNTLISTRSGNTTLMRLSTSDETADVRNNILYVTEDGSRLAMSNENGTMNLSNNWTKPGWVDSHGTLAGTINDGGGAVTGSSPGFVDKTGGDYHLEVTSDCIHAGTDLASGALPEHALLQQYVVHRGTEPRPVDGALDLGAFETCTTGDCTGSGDEVVETAPDLPPDAATDPSTDPSADALDDPAADPDTDPDDGDSSSGCGCSLVS